MTVQYDEHLTQLENNILLVQKRAMEQADIDPSWLGPDEENYTIVEPEFRGVRYLSVQIHRYIVFPCKKFHKLLCY